MLAFGFALIFEFVDRALAEEDFLEDVDRHEGHFLDDLLFVIEFREGFLEFFVELLEFKEQLVLGCFAIALLPLGVFFVDFFVEVANFFDQFPEGFEVLIAAGDFFIDDDAVEPFFGWFGDEFFSEGDMFLGGEAEAVNDAFDFVLSVLNSFADFDFLFSSEEGNFTHLFEVHPDGIVQDIEPAFVFFLFDLGLFDLVDGGLVNDLDFEISEAGIDFVEIFSGDDVIWEGVINVIVGEVSLFLSETEEFLDFLGEIDAGDRFDGFEGLGEISVRFAIGSGTGWSIP